MTRVIRYLSHPQVNIDPSIEIDRWSLSSVGRARTDLLACSGALVGTVQIISSAETKAVETAQILADALNCPHAVRPQMHENDRTATGFLPAEEFESVADQFFGEPDASVRGWETARDAQSRIVGEVQECLRTYAKGNILFVGHGAVGTLLYCHLARVPIDRSYDQGPNGGGCFFTFADGMAPPEALWQPMERLFQSDQ